MKAVFGIIGAALLLAGCGAVGHVKGRFVDDGGHGIPDAQVTFWRGSLLALVAPVLPERIAEVKTDSEGRFAADLPKRAHFISVRGGQRGGDLNLGCFPPAELLIHEHPYQPPDYSYVNSKRLPSASASVSVRVMGEVRSPGMYVLTRDDSVWKAIEAAGGMKSGAKGNVFLSRVGTEGPMRIIYPLMWSRRGEDKVPPVVGDGDIVAVDVSALELPK